MRTKLLDTETLRGLALADVTAWLHASGWTLSETVADRYFVFTKTTGGECFEAEIPGSAQLHDFPRRMAEALDVIEAADGRSQLELVQAIRQARVDVARLRLETEGTRGGRLPVESASAFYAQARDLMLAAACATVERRAAFPGRKPAVAVDFLRGLRFGPSETGSYIATIESNVPPLLQFPLPGVDPEPPFERRVMLTLAEGLHAAGRASHAASAQGSLAPFAEAVGAGLSANLCDAVAGLLEPFEASTLEIGITYAHARPAPSNGAAIRFARDLAPVLRAAGRNLRERDPQLDFEIEGYIVQLQSRSPSGGGQVSIACEVEGRIRSVRATLDGPAYDRAVEAHRNERRVALEGQLVRESGGLVVRAPRDLRLREEL